VREAGFAGLKCNIAIAIGNGGLGRFALVLEFWADDADHGVRAAARWALDKLEHSSKLCRHSSQTLRGDLFRRICGDPGGKDTITPVLFQFVPGALHLYFLMGRKPPGDLITRRGTSPVVFAEHGFISLFQVFADWATHLFLLRPSARPAVAKVMLNQAGNPNDSADGGAPFCVTFALCAIPTIAIRKLEWECSSMKSSVKVS
jgi:hypothetical protein